MCTSVLLAIVGGALIGKLVLRRRFGMGGCGHRGDMGGFGRHGRGFGWRGWRRGGVGVELADSREGIARLLGTLELNDRQREETAELLTKLTGAGVRGDRLRAVLASAGAETFEPILAEEALGFADLGARAKEVLDGVEHLHNILTPEQREKLRGFAPRV